MSNGWSVGPFGCLDNIPEFIVDAWVCGILTVATQYATVKKIEGGAGIVHYLGAWLCFPCFEYVTRSAIKEKYGIQTNGVVDLGIECYCIPCAVHQQIKEMTAKGDKPAQMFMGK